MNSQQQLDVLHEVMEEAERFHRRCVDLETILQERIDRKDRYDLSPTPERSACKRASMDLTRVLAKLRSPH